MGSVLEGHGLNTGKVLAVEIISICAALVSLILILLCVKIRQCKALNNLRKKRPRRTPRQDEYVDAMSTTAVSRQQVRIQQYEIAKPFRHSVSDNTITDSQNHVYHQPELVIEGGLKVRPRLDSKGYTEVELMDPVERPSPTLAAAAPTPSVYNLLGEVALKRTWSAPTGHCKAYNHIMLEPKVKGGSVKTTSLNVYDRFAKGGGGEQGKMLPTTSLEHQYDVSSASLKGSMRVAVIDGIYDKLEGAVGQKTGV